MSATAAASADMRRREESDRALGSLGALALAAGVLVLVALAGVSVLLAVRNAAALRVANQTEQARAAIADVITSAEDAETGQRGFLLTGRPSYLDPYTDGASKLPTRIEQLNQSLPPNARRRDLVTALDTAVADKLAELRQTLEFEQTGHRDAALALVQSDRGERAMDRIRALGTQLADDEQAIYESQISRVIEGGRLLVVADSAGLLLVLLLAGGVGLNVRRYLLALRQARAGLAVANGMLAGANANLERANGELEARVSARTADLTEANDEIQRFAYIVSHDLRAPLVNIMGFTGELEEAIGRLSAFIERQAARHPEDASPGIRAAATEELPEAIRFIKASSSKMDRLIAAILRLSREGQRVLVPERIDMAELIRGILDSLRHQTGQHDTHVEVASLPGLVADRLVLEQIFSNLIENALKYLKPGRPGRIAISGEVDNGRVNYKVADNGRGIATRDLERVFELFRRAGNQDVAGEGIGLAHVRALVRRLGGKIGCESTLDVGSTFHVTLPLKPPGDDPARPGAGGGIDGSDGI